ncbi:MAG: DUF2589 domain-containing protein, partial [Taibaiella sp.]|nr:DUF2589 domain-containing protein [Taibaiella sp.]
MSLSNYNPGQELSSINFGGMIGGPLTAVVDAQSQAALSTVSFIKSVGFTPDVVDDTTGAITPGSPVYVTFKYPKMVSPFVAAINGVVDSATVTSANGGTGYVVGDVLTLGNGGATVKVDAISGTGGITTVSVVTGGSGYSNGDETAAGGTGTGAKITVVIKNIDAVPAVFQQMMLEVPILTMLPIPYIRVDYAEIDFHAKINSMEYRNTASQFNLSSGFSSTSKTSVGASAGLNIKGIFGVNGGASYTNTVELKVNTSYQRSVKEGHKIDKTYQLGVKVKASQDEMPGGMEKILGILED